MHYIVGLLGVLHGIGALHALGLVHYMVGC